MNTTVNNNTEQHIINAAKQVFIEKGFAETSMSDIAARAGINRPALHYYFRTKERMFEAVCGDIIHSFLPMVQDIIMQGISLEKRISMIADIYIDVMERNKLLPLFMAREIHRDTPHFIRTINKLGVNDAICNIRDYLLAEMKSGNIRNMPIEYVFYTFYGLLTFPFLSKPLADVVFASEGRKADDIIKGWKDNIVRQMCLLLVVDKRAMH